MFKYINKNFSKILIDLNVYEIFEDNNYTDKKIVRLDI